MKLNTNIKLAILVFAAGIALPVLAHTAGGERYEHQCSSDPDKPNVFEGKNSEHGVTHEFNKFYPEVKPDIVNKQGGNLYHVIFREGGKVKACYLEQVEAV